MLELKHNSSDELTINKVSRPMSLALELNKHTTKPFLLIIYKNCLKIHVVQYLFYFLMLISMILLKPYILQFDLLSIFYHNLIHRL